MGRQKQKIYLEAVQIWKGLAPHIGGTSGIRELDLPRFVLDSLLLVGNCYYYVFDTVEARFEHIHPEMQGVLGYDPAGMDVPTFLSHIHPDDLPYFMRYESMVRDFFGKLSLDDIFHYKVSYDFRIRHQQGQFIRILQQVLTISHDDEGQILQTVGIHTDISHIKPTGKPILSFIGLNGRPSYNQVSDGRDLARGIKNLPVFTSREREILRLVCSGYSSKEIAASLNISIHTVHTHRKRILKKSNLGSVTELVSHALAYGWV